MLIRSAGLVLLFWSIHHGSMEPDDGQIKRNTRANAATDLKKIDIGLVNEFCGNNPYQKNDFPLICEEIKKFNGPIVTESKTRNKLIEAARKTEQSSPSSAGKSHRENFIDVNSKSEKILGLLEKSSTFMDTLGKFATESRKAAELAKKMSKFTGKLGSTLGALGTFASFLGPVGAGVGALFSVVSIFLQDDPTEQMQKFVQAQFDKVHERFDKLEIKLDKLDLGVKTTVVYVGYVENQDRIHRVMLSHRMMLKRLSNQTMFEFKEICRTENPLYPIDWIYRHTMSDKDDEFGPHLLPTIFEDVKFDRMRLLRFFSIMQADMMKAAYLREACLGSFYATNDTQLEIEVQENRKEMGEMISAVSRKMSWYESKLMNEFMPQLVLDVNVPLNVSKLIGKALVAEVKNILEQKYFWLAWTIDEILKSQGFGFGEERLFAPLLTSVTGDDKGIHHSMVKGNGERDLFLSWTENIEIVQHSMQDSAVYDGTRNANWTAAENAIGKTMYETIGEILDRKQLTPMPSLLSLGQLPYDNKIILVTPYDDYKNYTTAKNVYYYNYKSFKAKVAGYSTTVPMIIMIIYYYSKSATNTIGCNETLSKLKTWGNITDYGDDGSEFNRSITRNDACPPAAFQTKIGEMVRSSLVANPIEFTFDRIGSGINKTLTAYDDERNYSIYIFNDDNPVPLFRYSDGWEQPVVVVKTRVGATSKILGFGEKIVAVMWTFKNDPLITFQNVEAGKLLSKHDFKFNIETILSSCIEKADNHGFGIMDSCFGHLLEFITSPHVYCTLYNNSLSVLASKDACIMHHPSCLLHPFVRNAKNLCEFEFNFYDNKVVFVVVSRDYYYHGRENPSHSHEIYRVKGFSLPVHVFISYYKPHRIANTPQCMMTDKQLREHGIKSRDIYYC